MLTGYDPEPLPVPAPALTPALTPTPVVSTPAAETSSDSKPVDLSADRLEHDETGQTITAAGNVEMIQAGRILKADAITYNLATDTVTATGNIILNEPNGDIHFADSVTLNTEMREGFVQGLQSYLSNGGHFTASGGERTGSDIIMTDAAYTPCECDTDQGGRPGWQIRAKEVVYHQAENRVAYKNAKLEILGVPVLWTPYFSHSDGKIKRKSGLLTPDIGYDSQLGAMITNSYYWDIAPNRDATVGVMAMTKEAPVAVGNYRHRFESAKFEAEGSLTKSGRTDSEAGVEVKQDDEVRGHLFAEGLWDINEKWRAGLDVEVASDDQYMRQYDFSSDDVLENEVYVERFSGRHYAAVRALAFQDIRVQEDKTDQPNVLPEAEISFKGEPSSVLGGRWGLDLSALGLMRDGSNQDMARLSGTAGWHGRDVRSFGLMTTADLAVRGDAYYVADRDVAEPGSGRSNDGQEARAFPYAHLVSSLPLARPYERMQAVIEPVAALTLAPNINAEDSDIPNEDSQDVQIDASNLFEPNRFPGLDRIEDGSRATYGLRTGLYGYGGSYGDIFVGQSYRFNAENNPFPEGSGLTDQESDIVGQVAAGYDDDFGLNYRFQIDSRQMTSQRHEVDGFAHWGRLRLNSRYLFAKALEGTTISESREQLRNEASIDLSSRWRIRGGALHDLGADPGLREAMAGIDFFGCCVSVSTTAERTLTSDSSGDSGTEVMVRLGLKGLGGFQTSDYRQETSYSKTGF